MTLLPGDIIATGTPAGVGAAKGWFLHDGETVEVEVDGMGAVSNPIRVEEPSDAGRGRDRERSGAAPAAPLSAYPVHLTLTWWSKPPFALFVFQNAWASIRYFPGGPSIGTVSVPEEPLKVKMVVETTWPATVRTWWTVLPSASGNPV